jgi:hypothetical protein
MKDARAFFNEQALPSGKVLVLGSECPKDTSKDDWQTVELFDPSANATIAWTKGINLRNTDPVKGPFTDFHDDDNGNTYPAYIGAEATKILPPQGNGHTRILVPMEPNGYFDSSGNPHIDANSNGYVNQIYDVEADSWSAAPDRGTSSGPSDPAQAGEESWVLLPPTSDALNGSILTTDGSYQWPNLTARRYTFADANHPSDQWVQSQPRQSLPVEIRDGPAVVLPATTLSGEQAWYTGEFGTTAYYNIANGVWNTQAGPLLPSSTVAFDTPAAVLPTGQVLIVTGPPPDTGAGDAFPAPYSTWEFAPSTQNFTPSSLLTGPAARGVAEISPFYCHMLVLPTGQILMSTGPQKTLYLYSHTSDATDLNLTNLRPGINNIPNVSGNQFSLTGYRLNGVTEGAYYGDDASM